MSESGQNTEKAKKFLAAMSDRNVDVMDDLLADDLEYWVAGNISLSGIHTKSALLAMVPGVGQFFPDGLRVYPTEATAEGRRVALEATGGGKTAAGKVYDNRYHFLFEFDDAGKIAKLREYMDTGHAAEIFAG
jgi:ketosteroid isomerase-like protein